jgi:hypothetical protein
MCSSCLAFFAVGASCPCSSLSRRRTHLRTSRKVEVTARRATLLVSGRVKEVLAVTPLVVTPLFQTPMTAPHDRKARVRAAH